MAVALVALGGIAHAQQIAKQCLPCERGEQVLAALPDQGVALRGARKDLVALGITTTTITSPTEARLDTFRTARPDLMSSLGSLPPGSLSDVAQALCDVPEDTSCIIATETAMRCLRGECQIVNPLPPNDPPGCDPSVGHVRSPAAGLGFEWASGWQDDRYPVDGRAWSLGFEARRRIKRGFGFVARVDRSTGRDAAHDTSNRGRDDVSTGPVTRLYALAGPSYIFGVQHDREVVRYAQLDLLGGRQFTLSQSDEDDWAAGADLSYTWAVARFGVRALQGFGDADQARAVLVHVGFLVGGGPSFAYGSGCGRNEERSSTRWALGLDLPLFGYGLSSQLDYIAPGFGLETAYHASSLVDVLVRADLLDIPNGDRDRTLYSSALAGGRFDMSAEPEKGSRTGFFTTLMVGYSHAATVLPTTAGSGPVVDASVGWGGQGDDGGAFLRVHGRFGLIPDNVDARAIFLSAGLEYRLDRRKWKDRN